MLSRRDRGSQSSSSTTRRTRSRRLQEKEAILERADSRENRMDERGSTKKNLERLLPTTTTTENL